MVSREEYFQYLSNMLTDEEKSKLEKSVKKRKIRWSVVMAISGAIILWGVIELIIGLVTSNFNINFLVKFIFGFIAFIIGIVFVSIVDIGSNNIVSKHKEDVINYLLSDMTYFYDMHGQISEVYFKKAGLGLYYEKFESEDLLQIQVDGNKSNVNLIVADVKTTYETTDSEGETTTHTEFSGVFGYVTFPQAFKCQLTLNRPTYTNRNKLDVVKLEDIEFGKMFYIKSDNQVEARYILTPDLMQRLKHLGKKTKMSLVLDGHNMYITFPYRNLFTIRSSKSKVEEVFARFYDDIEILLSIVKEIEDNDKVFKID